MTLETHKLMRATIQTRLRQLKGSPKPGWRAHTQQFLSRQRHIMPAPTGMVIKPACTVTNYAFSVVDHSFAKSVTFPCDASDN